MLSVHTYRFLQWQCECIESESISASEPMSVSVNEILRLGSIFVGGGGLYFLWDGALFWGGGGLIITTTPYAMEKRTFGTVALTLVGSSNIRCCVHCPSLVCSTLIILSLTARSWSPLWDSSTWLTDPGPRKEWTGDVPVSLLHTST